MSGIPFVVPGRVPVRKSLSSGEKAARILAARRPPADLAKLVALAKAAKARQVRKLPLVACYDAQGRLLGAVEPSNIVPLAAGTPVDPNAPAVPVAKAGRPAGDAVEARIWREAERTIRRPVDLPAATVEPEGSGDLRRAVELVRAQQVASSAARRVAEHRARGGR